MKRLLVVDDQAGITGLLKMLFQHLGYEVMVRETGEEALQVYKEVDLLITDYYLSDISGVDVVKAIREKRALPIVVMSGLIDEAKAALTDYPSVYFVGKLFSIKDMERVVTEALQTEVPVR
ncbi:MAG: response regulator [Bacillota bacterium]